MFTIKFSTRMFLCVLIVALSVFEIIANYVSRFGQRFQNCGFLRKWIVWQCFYIQTRMFTMKFSTRMLLCVFIIALLVSEIIANYVASFGQRFQNCDYSRSKDISAYKRKCLLQFFFTRILIVALFARINKNVHYQIVVVFKIIPSLFKKTSERIFAT